MTELSKVSGSWPKEAVVVASKKSLAEGCRMGIAACGTETLSLVGDAKERKMPIRKIIIA